MQECKQVIKLVVVVNTVNKWINKVLKSVNYVCMLVSK